MKKGFTLIEIIFTIVIMAGIFMVIPKILMIASKNESFSMKQDAFFNAISLTKIASSLAWDEANTQTLSVLRTQNNDIPCDATTHIRVGSFLSANGRTCEDTLDASSIQSDGESDYLLYNDIDDFNGTIINTKVNGENRYKITTIVDYINPALSSTAKKMTIDLNTSTKTSDSSNLKRLTTTIKYNGKKAIHKNKTIATFSYTSANIGQFSLNKREW